MNDRHTCCCIIIRIVTIPPSHRRHRVALAVHLDTLSPPSPLCPLLLLLWCQNPEARLGSLRRPPPRPRPAWLVDQGCILPVRPIMSSVCSSQGICWIRYVTVAARSSSSSSGSCDSESHARQPLVSQATACLDH